MPVMMPEVTVWAEEGGIELRAVPHSGTVEISIIKDGKVAATATVARYRWDRIWQAVLPPPEWAAQQADIASRREKLSQYRVWMRSRPGQYAQYEGKVDVFAEDKETAVAAALIKLRRTSFPDRADYNWFIEKVEELG